MAFRYDRGTLRRPETLPGGRVRVDGALTRSGVFEYRNPDGTIRKEYRPPEEVSKASSLATLVGAPFTDDHPAEGQVNTENADRLARGSVLEPRMDGAFVIGTIVVTSKPVIDKMRAGKLELSCGYEADIDETPGTTPTGERYDCIQRNIQYNHVALVAVGRAGPQARVRMDSASQVAPIDNPTETTMDFEKKFLEATAEAAREKARADAAVTDANAQRARADRAEGERDAQKARADSAEKARTDAATGESARVRARVELEGVAKSVLGADFKPEMDDGAIKRAIVKRVDAVDIPADKSPDYLEGFYSSAVKRADKAAASLNGTRAVVDAGGRQYVDANDEPPEIAARKKMILEMNRPAKMGGEV